MANQFKKVFVILGNHEFYAKEYSATIEMTRAICKEHENLIFLDCNSYLIPNTKIRILGCTLWSHVPEDAEQEVERSLSDYAVMRIVNPQNEKALLKIKVKDTNKWHKV